MRGYLGNQTRSRPKQSSKPNKGNSNQTGRRRRSRRPQNDALPDDDGSLEVIPADQLEQSKSAMNLTELKTRPASALVELGESLGLDDLARSRKQDIIFSILKAHAKNGEDVYGDGVLEILQDGFGFLRSADSSYLAGPDDIYVSPSQIRRFSLRTGDTVAGLIRPRWPLPIGATISMMRAVRSSVLPLPCSSTRRSRGNSGVRFSKSTLLLAFSGAS